MTLQQLKYTITLAETGTITEAANKLYISQPSLIIDSFKTEEFISNIGEGDEYYNIQQN